MKVRLSHALAATLILFVAVAGTASAHKTTYTPDGNFKLVWGFLNEPATTMTKNGLDLRIVDNASQYAIPGLEGDLKAELHHGDDEIELPLSGQHGKPGYYTALVTPSKPGIYTLHLSGMINGTEYDLEIPSAHDVDPLEDTYFPPYESPDVEALSKQVAELAAKVAALDAKLKAEAASTVPTTQVKAETPAPAIALLALAAVGVALLLRRRS